MKNTLIYFLVLSLLLSGCGAAGVPEVGSEASTVAEETLWTGDDGLFETVEETVETTEPANETQPTELVEFEEPSLESANVQVAEVAGKPIVSQTPATTKPATTVQTSVATEPARDTTQAEQEFPKVTATNGEDYPAATENGVLFFMESTHNIGVGCQVKAEYVYHGSGKLTWYTSSRLGISVDQTGVITPLLEGNYKVYVSDGTYTAVTEVFAPQNWYGSPHSMYFENSTLELIEGKSTLIPVTDGTSYGPTGYTSSDPSVATITGSYITAVAPGTCIITASRYGCTAKLIVTVVPAVDVTTLDIVENDVQLYSEQTQQLNKVYDGECYLQWSSSNTNVASVDENGMIIAWGEGSCYIYLSDGTYADQCLVTVSIDPDVKVTQLTLNSANGIFYDGVTRYKGDYITFRVNVAPSNASQATKIIVSDPGVISVSRSYFGNEVTFRLDFKSAGTCVVDIVSGDDAVTCSYTVYIKESYACDSGSGLLTPEEFVDCYNHVLNANGMSQDIIPTGYLMLTVNPDELTWAKARASAEGLSHHWWSIGYRHMIITYEGTNEYGQYIFYERGA